MMSDIARGNATREDVKDKAERILARLVVLVLYSSRDVGYRTMEREARKHHGHGRTLVYSNLITINEDDHSDVGANYDDDDPVELDRR